MSHVVISIGASRFALSMDAVAQVGKLPGCTRVPGAPHWVAGVANWRGRVLGVIDLRELMSLPPAADGAAKDARLVILASGPVQVGLLADRVDGVIDIEPHDVEPSMLSLGDEVGSLLMGQANDAEGPIGVLDESAVFGLRSRLVGARRAG